MRIGGSFKVERCEFLRLVKAWQIRVVEQAQKARVLAAFFTGDGAASGSRIKPVYRAIPGCSRRGRGYLWADGVHRSHGGREDAQIQSDDFRTLH